MKTENDTRRVAVSLTVNEAIALNNYTMELLNRNYASDAPALRRASRKLLDALNDADPVEVTVKVRVPFEEAHNP